MCDFTGQIRKDQAHPWVMLAVAFHEKKETRVHELIVQDVVNATPALKGKKYKVTVITDDETALWKAWKPYAELLRCCNHFQRNFEDFLRHDLHITKDACTSFIQAVFKPGGLVDCEDEEEYEAKLAELKMDFDSWETVAANRKPGHSSKAYNWLKRRSKSVGKRLLKCARRKAKFPVHNRPYTNGAEGFNQRLKQTQKENGDHHGKLSFLQYLESIILKVEKNMQVCFMKAVIGQGMYHLSADFQKLALPVHVWVSMSEKSKQDYLSKATKLTIREAKRGLSVPVSVEENAQEEEDKEVIHIPPKVTDILLCHGLPEATVALIVSGAEELLRNVSQITKTPGKSKEYLVSSKSTSGLNTCKVNTLNVTCTCKGYKSKVACKHSLAVALKENMLDLHLQWLAKQPTKGNKTVLLSQSKPGTGQKGGRPKFKGRRTQLEQGGHRYQSVSKDDPAFSKPLGKTSK